MTGQGRPSIKGIASLGADIALDEQRRSRDDGPGLNGSEPQPAAALPPTGQAADDEVVVDHAPGRPARSRRARAARATRALLPAAAVLALVVLHPGLASTDERAVRVLACLALALVVASSGVAAYVAWRLDDRTGLAWVSTGLVLLGLYGAGGWVLALTGLNLSDPLRPTTVVDLFVVAAAAACAVAAVATPFPARDPLVVGVLAAITASAVRVLMPRVVAEGLGDTGASLLAVGTAALAVGGAVALLSARLPAELRWSLATAFLLGGSLGVAGGALRWIPTTPADWLAAAGLAAATTAAVVLGRRLREMERHHQRSMRSLALRTSRAEAAQQHNQDRMHELRATAAGVASASEVLSQQDTELSPARRAALCELLVDETARLRRLTQSFERGKVERVELDDVLGRVVSKQRALGQVVRWEPSELAVEADADMLREVVDLLLVNAQLHAPGAWVRVNARARHSQVVVRVRDTGPGVAPEVADRLFERGVRGEASEGSGVGLHLARRLVEEMGGALHREPTQTGTCFVLTLVPHVEEVGHGTVAAGEHPHARGAC